MALKVNKRVHLRVRLNYFLHNKDQQRLKSNFYTILSKYYELRSKEQFLKEKKQLRTEGKIFFKWFQFVRYVNNHKTRVRTFA